MAELPTIPKVVAYITQAQRLLVFRHPQVPAAGIQVPAGTLEPGEPPAQGVLREAREETGLQDLHLLASLGETQFDARPFGTQALHQRFFFHLECRQPTPPTWQHHEAFAASGAEPPLFEFYWVPMPAQVPDLIAEFGACLPQLYRRLGLPG